MTTSIEQTARHYFTVDAASGLAITFSVVAENPPQATGPALPALPLRH